MRTFLLALVLGIVPPAFAGNDDFGGLPPGPGQEEVFILCDACHSIKLVTQQGLDRDAWDETLDYMTAEQGMPELEPDERRLILDYLAKNIGPDSRR